MPTSSPIILIATTERWYPTARLGMALADAGFVVHAVCPSHHPLATTGAVQQRYPYSGLAPLKSFALAITASKADFVIPGDDLATRHLLELHASKKFHQKEISRVIQRSLGAPENFQSIYARARLIELAAELGIRVPPTGVISNASELNQWIQRFGLPTVLKANNTSGGDGVKVVHTAEEAHRAFRKLQRPPLFARALKRAVIDQDTTLLVPSLLRRRHTINVQAFIAGREATSAVTCLHGKVLASLHFEVINKVHAAGHATVIRRIENPEMQSAAEKIVGRLNLSGFHGFDFMIESQTGNAYLIEMNPRATQVGHLSLGPGRDLPAALYAALTGQSVRATEPVTDNETIALFPQEWQRDAASPFLTSAYHDIPWKEPKLVQLSARKLGKKHALRPDQDWFTTVSSRSSQKYLSPRLDCETD